MLLAAVAGAVLLAAAPESIWGRLFFWPDSSPWRGEGHIRALFFAAILLSVGDTFVAIHLYSQSADWVGSAFWIIGCVCWAYSPAKVLVACPDPFSLVRVCVEWNLLFGIVLWIVGCAWCFLPKTGPRLFIHVDVIFLIGSVLMFVSTSCTMIRRIGELPPGRWSETMRPPAFLVDFLSTCLYVAASILEMYKNNESIEQLGLCLWLPGSLLGFYVSHELLREKVEDSGAFSRQLSPWEHSVGEEYTRVWIFGAASLSIGSACVAFKLYFDWCLWLGYGLWILGCMCLTHLPVKQLLTGPDPLSVERACNEWCTVSGLTLWIVGSSFCLPPSTRELVRPDVARALALGSVLVFVAAAYQLLDRFGESWPSRWPGSKRPPAFLVQFLSACFFMAAALLGTSNDPLQLQLGLCLWFPGSALGFYVAHELLRQKTEEVKR